MTATGAQQARVPAALARVVAIEALRRLVADYCAELDTTGGLNAIRYLTPDCRMDVGNMQLRGHAEIARFYEDFNRKVAALGPAATRTTRHLATNLRIDLGSAGEARAEAIMVNFSAMGARPIPAGTVPTVISDVYLGCRLGSDGEWRIFEFTGGAVFIGGDPLQNKALVKE